jgi:hypothetical protein
MTDQLGLLEDRIGRAADGLKRLREERDRLQQRVRTLEHGTDVAGEERKNERSWRSAKSDVVAALRQAVLVLREE